MSACVPARPCVLRACVTGCPGQPPRIALKATLEYCNNMILSARLGISTLNRPTFCLIKRAALHSLQRKKREIDMYLNVANDSHYLSVIHPSWNE